MLRTRSLLTLELHEIYSVSFYSINEGNLDNPDQRITQDVENFAYTICQLLEKLCIQPFMIIYYTIQSIYISGYLAPAIIYGYFILTAFTCSILSSWIVPVIFLREKMEVFL